MTQAVVASGAWWRRGVCGVLAAAMVVLMPGVFGGGVGVVEGRQFLDEPPRPSRREQRPKEKPPTPSAEEGRRVFAPGGGARGDAAAEDVSWTIVLVGFRGETREADAASELRRVRTGPPMGAGLSDATAQVRGENVVIRVGRFESEEDPRARAELARIRSMRVVGMEYLRSAILAPPYGAKASGGVNPAWDLRRARELYGVDALYTLQVGAYTRGDLGRASAAEMKEFREAAEEAAAVLRREGELAFFYHGPNGSMVTVGIFGPEDFDPQNPRDQSGVLREARKRFPLALLNGKGYRVRVRGVPERDPKAWQMQPSALVAVPER